MKTYTTISHVNCSHAHSVSLSAWLGNIYSNYIFIIVLLNNFVCVYNFWILSPTLASRAGTGLIEMCMDNSSSFCGTILASYELLASLDANIRIKEYLDSNSLTVFNFDCLKLGQSVDFRSLRLISTSMLASNYSLIAKPNSSGVGHSFIVLDCSLS